MNWLTNFVKPKLSALVRKKEVPENLWNNCPSCASMIHHKDLKQLSDMIDNVVYLYNKGWTKEELKNFIDKYCLASEDDKLTIIQDNKKTDGMINSYRP